MLTRGILRYGWHHDRWAWVGNIICSRHCILLPQIFTLTFWYSCVTHSHLLSPCIPFCCPGSLTPWSVDCLRKKPSSGQVKVLTKIMIFLLPWVWMQCRFCASIKLHWQTPAMNILSTRIARIIPIMYCWGMVGKLQWPL